MTPCNDLAARYERSAGQAKAAAFRRDGRVPDYCARLRVERHHVHVRSADVELVTVERHVALDGRPEGARQLARVVPELVARRGVERLNVIAERVHVDDAVVHERRRRVRSGRAATTTTRVESRHVALVDQLRSGEKPRPSRVRRQLSQSSGEGFVEQGVGHRRVRVETARRRGPASATRRPRVIGATPGSPRRRRCCSVISLRAGACADAALATIAARQEVRCALRVCP